MQEYIVDGKVYLTYNDTEAVKIAREGHRALKKFDAPGDWSMGSWGIDAAAYDFLVMKGIPTWLVYNTIANVVYAIPVSEIDRVGHRAVLNTNDGPQIFVPVTAFEVVE